MKKKKNYFLFLKIEKNYVRFSLKKINSDDFYWELFFNICLWHLIISLINSFVFVFAYVFSKCFDTSFCNDIFKIISFVTCVYFNKTAIYHFNTIYIYIKNIYTSTKLVVSLIFFFQNIWQTLRISVQEAENANS